jgi:hypothetical protein
MLAIRFPATRVEARRAFVHLLNTIRAVALLRQRQKPSIDHQIVADEVDYRIALSVVAPSLTKLRGTLNQAVMRLLAIIQEQTSPGEIITRSLAACWAGIRESDAGPRLRVLADFEYLIELEPHRGNRAAKYTVNARTPQPLARVLSDFPTEAEIAAELNAGGGQ